MQNDVFSKLVKESIGAFYDPEGIIEWPETLSLGKAWMGDDLLSTYGTGFADELTAEQKMTLSQAELVHLFSYTHHGEQDIVDVANKYMYMPRFEPYANYLFYMLTEENSHRYIFNRFCTAYYEGMFPNDLAPHDFECENKFLEALVAFIKNFIVEEIVLYYNRRIENNKSLPDVVRQICALHNTDESRHLVAGRQIIQALLADVRDTASPDEISRAVGHISSYTLLAILDLYNPRAYAKAGLLKPGKWVRQLSRSKERQALHRKMVNIPSRFLNGIGFIQGHILDHLPRMEASA